MTGVAVQRVRVRLGAVLAAALTLQLVLPLLPDRTGLILANSLICSAGWYATVRFARMGLASRGRRRGAWMTGACASGLLGLSYIVFLYYAIFDVDPPPPRLADLLSAAAATVCLPAVMLAAPRTNRPIARVRSLIDVATVAGALTALHWQFVIGPASSQMSSTARTVLFLSLTPEILGAALALVLMSSSAPGDDGYFLHLLASGMAAFAVAAVLSVRNYVGEAPWYADGAGACYLLGALLIAVSSHASIPSEDATRQRHMSGLWIMFPYVPVLLAISSVTVLYVRTGTLSPVLMWALLSTSVLALMRQFITLFTTRQLLRELDEQRRRLDLQAHRDSLTRLSNRVDFYRRAADALAGATLNDHTAVLMLDLDGFKPVNDTYGHAAGDEVLIEVAKRIRSSVRVHDLASRLGGDEFAVLLPGVTGPAQAHETAERILRRIAEPMSVAGADVTPGASIGIAIVTGPRDSIDQVLRDADTALYDAKSAGRGVVRQHAHPAVAGQPAPAALLAAGASSGSADGGC